MKFLHIFGSAIVAVSLAACSSSTRGTVPLIGANATLAEAEVAFDELEASVIALSVLEGNTLEANLPAGDATYQGIISGGDGADGGIGDVTHYGDLRLSTNFATTDVTGSITNVVTDVVDFENPTGTIDVTGNISNDGGVATIDFAGSGPLVGDGVEANYNLLGADGNFVGTDGAGIEGSQDTDFVWTLGPDVGFPDISDGNWYAER